MRNLFLILLLTLSSRLFAAQAIVIVLEAPLLEEPSLDSNVKQVVRKGDKIYLHDRHFSASDWESTSGASQKDILVDVVYDEEFYQALSKDGLPAYIQTKYVKVIYQDDRELTNPVSRFEVDPTDYRLEEPLPEGYPLSDKDKKKAAALFSMGTHSKSSYQFNDEIIDEDYANSYGLTLLYMTKVDYDLFDRFYFGTKIGFENNNVDFGFANGANVKQSLGRYSIGPHISFDIYKTERTRLTAYTNISLTYHRAYLTYEDINEGLEERSFSAWGITPEIGTMWQWTEIIPDTDLVLGANIVTQPGVEMTPSSEGIGNYWNNELDVLTTEAGLRASFTLGIQARY
tara:strand:+ start:952 stop:1983 length:1032 start_codon:yes stop_codon:yes gene_type:complete